MLTVTKEGEIIGDYWKNLSEFELREQAKRLTEKEEVPIESN